MIIATLFSCNEVRRDTNESHSLKELKRVRSPDKKVDAVLVETNAGATTSYSNKVFLVMPGKRIVEDDLQYAVFSADHYQNIAIKWEANRQLLISYYKARIFNYTNFWQTGELENWNYVVEVKLQCSSTNGQLSDMDQHPMSK
ncbi:MAG: hypothetical protein EOP45_18285 [Sphingobacteriaceae bacterium]|nr:MAG: hypothetical protein EOP45_18285 [Sphingobacteriaceae bacterium]